MHKRETIPNQPPENYILHEIESLNAQYESTPIQQHLPMSSSKSMVYERTMGFGSESLQNARAENEYRVAGVGGGGLMLAWMYARLGGRFFSVTDPGYFDESNMRIPIIRQEHLGRNKAEVARELILEANATAEIEINTEGITQDNAKEFLSPRSKKGNRIIAIDEIDMLRQDMALVFARTARSLGITVMTATDMGRGGFVTSFHPDKPFAFERHAGMKDSITPEKVKEMPFWKSIIHMPYLPGDGTLSTLNAVMNGSPMPTTPESILSATNLAISQLDRHVMEGVRGYRRPAYSPEMRVSDPSNDVGFVTRHPTFSMARSLIGAIVNDKILHRNPTADYSLNDQLARARYRMNFVNNNATT